MQNCVTAVFRGKVGVENRSNMGVMGLENGTKNSKMRETELFEEKVE